ncbi:MAG: hypothetical protein ACK5Q5_09275 [Planctomycetaceae bacterium]
MTGYTVHTGSSKKFAQGWDNVFKGAAKSAAKSTPVKPKPKTPKKSK